MNPHHYTPEEIEFLRENAKGRRSREIAELFNGHFGLTLSVVQIKSALKNRKISNGLKHYCEAGYKSGYIQRKRVFNSEQEKYLAENIRGRSRRELADMFNEHFGLNLSFKSICRKLDRLSLRNGLRYIRYPIGAEVEYSKYVRVKTADPSVFMLKHVLIWEAKYGSVPQGHCIIFADGNRHNFDLKNLVLVSRRQLGVLNRCRLLGNTIEQTKTGLAIADVYLKVADMKKNRTAKEV